MTTFSFYKPEGSSSYMLKISVEGSDNDKQVGEDSVPMDATPCGGNIPEPEAFYNFLGTYTERIVQEARTCWNLMTSSQRAQFSPAAQESSQSQGKGDAQQSQNA